MHNQALLTAVTAMLAALPASHAMYSKSSPVLQVTGKSFDRLIAQSNHTSIVEFYAPWCGHCRNLQPAYEKVARDLQGMAKVAAIDCDEESNKAFCGSMGVQGFPTLKIVRPSKTPGNKPVIEDYQGKRSPGDIAQAVSGKINNHVTRVADANHDDFLAKPKPKALLFSKKGTTSGLIRGIAIDFLDVITVGQVRDKETATVKKYGIESFPALVLIPGDGGEPILYDGEMKKKDMVKFLSQAGEPNPDPAPSKGGKPKSKPDSKTKTKSKSETKTKKADTKTKKAEPEASAAEEEPSSSSEAPAQQSNPAFIHIKRVLTQEDLTEKCLTSKSQTCVIAFYEEGDETADKAIDSLSHLNTKFTQAGRHIFPFYAVGNHNEAASTLPGALKLEGGINVVAVNARRAWWRHYEGDYSIRSFEDWVDMIRMGEGAKSRLPSSVITKTAEEEKPKEEEKIVHEDL